MIKMPIHDIELERVVLGALMIEKHAIAQVSSLLRPEMFYKEEHHEIAQCIFSLFRQSKAIDIMTVFLELKETGNRLNISPAEITSITNSVTSSAHLVEHVAKLAEYYMAREVQQITGRAFSASGEWGIDVFDLISTLQKDITTLLSQTMQGGLKPIDSLIVPTLKYIDQIQHGVISGVATEIDQFDKIFYGFKEQELHVIAARPGCGKTALALQILREAAKKGKRGALYSLEMSSRMMIMRMLSSESGVPFSKIQRNQMEEWERDLLNSAASTLAKLPIYIDDSFSQNVQVLHSKAIQRQFSGGVDFVIVDYLQLIGGSKGGKNQNREQVIAEISRGLKAMSKDLNVPVIALSQMSRAIESGGRKEPVLSDLRESGAIEQDADSVTFLTPEEDDQPFGSPRTVNVKVAKHRGGALAKFQLIFDGNYQRFTDPMAVQQHATWYKVHNSVDEPF
jgi:replicative DNA helicase